MPPFNPTPERREHSRAPRLEQILRREEARLTVLAQPGHPLTPERLGSRVPGSRAILAEAAETGLEWPDRRTAVPVHIGARSREYFVHDSHKADSHFALEAMQGRNHGRGQRGFNNFSALLRSQPYKPHGREDFSKAMMADPAAALYGSKPYLLRAYLVAPEFMDSLRTTVKGLHGYSDWNETIIRGGMEPDEYPADAAVLRASRLAYGLLSNLMRTDDLRLQSEWLGFGSTQQLISDPEIELWT